MLLQIIIRSLVLELFTSFEKVKLLNGHLIDPRYQLAAPYLIHASHSSMYPEFGTNKKMYSFHLRDLDQAI